MHLGSAHCQSWRGTKTSAEAPGGSLATMGLHTSAPVSPTPANDVHTDITTKMQVLDPSAWPRYTAQLHGPTAWAPRTAQVHGPQVGCSAMRRSRHQWSVSRRVLITSDGGPWLRPQHYHVFCGGCARVHCCIAALPLWSHEPVLPHSVGCLMVRLSLHVQFAAGPFRTASSSSSSPTEWDGATDCRGNCPLFCMPC